MNGVNITYKVVGRYMNGKEVAGYHFIGSDNSSMALDKKTTIQIINRGLVENMRITTNNDELIIRGKGINLNTLPVYDESKQKYRPGAVSQNAANSSNRASGIDSRNNMATFKIIKRIMRKTSCIGYVLEDVSGNTRKVSRETVIECASNNRISNAVVNKVIDPVTGNPTFALRGVNGCSIKKLPIMIVDDEGKIIDPAVNKDVAIIRATRMKSAGQVANRSTGKVDRFTVGDFIIINISGKLEVIPGPIFVKNYRPEKECGTATCDYSLDCLADYTIEIYGNNAMVISPEQAKTWLMAKHI